MNSKRDSLEKAAEIRDLLKNNDITPEEAALSLKDLQAEAEKYISESNTKEKFSDLKSLLVNYNLANYSDLTLILYSAMNEYEIIEYAGDRNLIDHVYSLIDQDVNFFSNLEKTDINGSLYLINHESMSTDQGKYTVLTFSESHLMKPSSFHILCDIVMDIIKTRQFQPVPVQYDFFESLSIEINSYLARTGSFKSFNAYIFSFRHITRFFRNSSFTLISELSSDIEKKLSSMFGPEAGVFKISLSMFLVIIEKDSEGDAVYNKIRDEKMDFIIRGTVLPYISSRISCDSETSSYTLLQKIMTLDEFRIRI